MGAHFQFESSLEITSFVLLTKSEAALVRLLLNLELRFPMVFCMWDSIRIIDDTEKRMMSEIHVVINA